MEVYIRDIHKLFSIYDVTKYRLITRLPIFKDYLKIDLINKHSVVLSNNIVNLDPLKTIEPFLFLQSFLYFPIDPTTVFLLLNKYGRKTLIKIDLSIDIIIFRIED